MLPWIAGAIVVGVGAYLLDSAESENSSARKEYKRERKRSVASVESSFEEAERKDNLDKLFKIKRAKREVADGIYNELKSYQENFSDINLQLKNSKEMLSVLFLEKKSLATQKEKRAVQENINIVLDSRKELFKIKDELHLSIKSLKARLKEANQETKDIQEQINQIV